MIPRSLFSLACALFFISGAAGLVYEVIWFKRFAHVWGSSALAAASVLASYLLGLGAGASVLGRLADRARVPLRGYGWCEVGIGALALLVPFGIGLLERAAAALYPLLADRPLVGSLVRALLTLVVIGPPCFLMGGTFPLLVKQLTPRGGTLREATGILYAANTLGGAAGAYLAGFHLLPALGLQATNGLAVAVNLAAGAGALALARFVKAPARDLQASPRTVEGYAAPAPRRTSPDGPGTSRPTPAGRSARLAFAAALLSGCASLALQIAWTRQLSLIVGGSTYAFTAMLFVVLAGIGIGGLVYHLWLREAGNPRTVQGVVTLALIATACLGQLLVEPSALVAGSVSRFRADPWWNAAACAAAASVLELLPAVGMGILIPLYVSASGRGPTEAGRTVGDIYAWNTAGTILGALGGALLVLPAWGVAATAGCALGLYLLAALLLFPTERAWMKLAAGGIAAAGIGIVLLAARGSHPLVTNLGLYMYGDLDADLKKAPQVLHFEEGISTNVMVLGYQEGLITLRVNGKVDASTGRDMETQLGLAYVPRCFRPEAREVFVIGFGSGTTSGASLLFPGTRVTCAEIEPAVPRAAVHFKDVNHRPLDCERFHLVLNDGRGHLQGTRDRYDFIISEPSNPWIAGVSNLFTVEFYRIVKERLRPGGVLVQWIQVYSLSPADFALIVRTIRQVFPHGALLRTSPGDTILLASREPLELTAEILDRAQGLVHSLPPVQADLEKHYGVSDVRSILLSRRILGDEGLDRLIAKFPGAGVHTDLNLRLEFDTPLRLFDKELRTPVIRKSILAAADTSGVPEIWKRWGCTRAQLPALRELLDYFAEHEEWEPAKRLIELGLSVEPEEPRFLGARFLSAMPAEEKAWDEQYSRILRLLPEEAARVGVVLHLNKDYERALRVWQRLLESHSQSATLWVNLATTYEAQGKAEEARAAMEKARALDPFSSVVRRRLENEADGE